jgi:hypothetical protein
MAILASFAPASHRRCSLSHRSQTIGALAHTGFELLHLSAKRIGTCRLPECGNEQTVGQVPVKSAFMSDTAVPRPSPASPSPFGLALWRLATAVLYGFSLLLVPHHLPSAVFALLASLLCLPGARLAIWAHTGLRIPGVGAASGAFMLLLCAVLSAGWQADAPMASAGAGELVVVSSSSTSKP